MKEYRDYEATVSRVADLGAAYENVSRPDMPRKPSLSPGKRPSITTCKCHNVSFIDSIDQGNEAKEEPSRDFE